MGRLLALSVALLVLLPSTVVADTIYVHPGGAGDYTTVREGVANATVDDTVLVARNLIRSNGARGIYTYHYWGIIEDNEICEHVRGIIGACCEEPTVRRNHIHHNTATGAAPGFYLDITENLFEYNGTGVYGGMGGLIKDNIIRYNEIGVFLDAYGDIPVHCNDLHGDTAYNLKIGYGSGSLDATMNWRGTTDPDEIAAGIWDCEDDPGIGCCVLFEPWCVTPGCEACPVERAGWGAIKAMYR